MNCSFIIVLHLQLGQTHTEDMVDHVAEWADSIDIKGDLGRRHVCNELSEDDVGICG